MPFTTSVTISLSSLLSTVVPFLLFLLSGSPARAQSVLVTSLAELEAEIAGVSAGDTIVVANGVYTTTGEIPVLHKEGTETAPIVIMSETIGGATITGAGSFNLKGTTRYVVIHGFKFTHLGLTGNYNSGEYCTYTRNDFECPENTGTNGASSSYLRIFGSHNTVSYNTFRNKTYRGPILSIQPSADSGKGRFNHVHHNHFVDFPDEGLNDNSAIQPGYNAGRAGDANLLIEHNLFERMNADAEGVMSVKSNKVTFRYNTIRDCRDVSLRDGVESEVYGNYFFGGRASGVRFADDDHKIYNNVFVGVPSAIKLFSRINPDNPTVFSHAKPDNCFVGFNTMVNCGKGFWHDGTGSSENLILVNNLYYDCDIAVDLDRAQWSNPVLDGNVIWESPAGVMNDSAYREQDPLFTFDAFGVPHLTAASPVRGGATGDFPFVTNDIDKDPRPEAKDTGADQYTTNPSRNLPLTINDVGPGAGLAGTGRVLIIPGGFEAEAYAGGTGVLSDTTADGGGNQALTGIIAGDWATYDVNVQLTSTYEVTYRVASTTDSIKIEASTNGTPLSTTVAPPTGGEESWVDLKDTLILTAGRQSLRLDFLTGGWRFNQLSFRKIAGVIPPVVAFDVPTDTLTLEEGYDLELEVLVSDEDGEVAFVQLFIDGVFLRQESVAPYTWGHDGAPNPDEVNGLEVGNYVFRAVATDNDGNINQDSFLLAVVPTGTTAAGAGVEAADRLVLFPNPTGNQLHLAGLPASAVNVEVIDGAGRSVAMPVAERFSNGLRWDVSTLPGGVYFVRVRADGGYLRRKFIKR